MTRWASSDSKSGWLVVVAGTAYHNGNAVQGLELPAGSLITLNNLLTSKAQGAVEYSLHEVPNGFMAWMLNC